MKKQFKVRPLALAAALILALGSCESAPEPAKKIENGKFGGILLDSTSAASSAPAVASSETEESIFETTWESEPETSDSALLEPADTDNEADEDNSVHAEDISEQTTTTTTAATTTTTTTVTTTTTAKTTTSAATTTAATTTAAAATAATTTAAAPASSTYRKNSYKARNYSSQKAVWISYIELNNILLGKSESEFRKAIGGVYDNCVSLGLNTVYVHVRAYGDAFYFSSLYPFTKYISGKLGTRTSFDPLTIMVEEAHDRKLSFHAWINPLRLCNGADMMTVPSTYKAASWYNGAEKGKYLVQVGDTWYLNPAYSDAVKLVGDGVREIVSNYDVDGVHIDDYFYPTTDASFDSAAFAVSGKASLAEFRTENINNLVREIYNAAHGCGTGVMFGASPQGNMTNNTTILYADAAAWCKGGYIDYFTPQIYYGFENVAQPFKTCTDGWRKLVSGTSTKLYVGLAVYKAGNEDKWAGSTGIGEWQNTRTMLKRQIEYINSCPECSGFAFYCYNYLFTDGYRTAAMKEEIENFKPLLK